MRERHPNGVGRALHRRPLDAGAWIARRLRIDALAYRVFAAVRLLRSPKRVVDNIRLRRRGAPDGMPIPPGYLISLVSGSPSIADFLRTGRTAADAVRRAVEAAGHPLESMSSVLDFGCGCGRVLRHWAGVRGPEFFGCDYNRRPIVWSRRHLPFAQLRVSDVLPPLDYAPESFDLVYALSVLTHMTEQVQGEWMAELRRVLRPGAFLLITTHGEHYESELPPVEARQFANGGLVVRRPAYAGTNVCAAYHPRRYVVEQLAAGLDLIAHRPGGPTGCGRQDLYLFRKPDRRS